LTQRKKYLGLCNIQVMLFRTVPLEHWLI